MPKVTATNGSNPHTEQKKHAVALVVDHYLDDEPGHLTTLSDLLKPQAVRLSVIHAMADLSSTIPFKHSEEERFHVCQTDHCKHIAHRLEEQNYDIKSLSECGMSDACAGDILQMVQENGHELLVVASSQPKAGPFHRSHFASRLASYATCPVLMLTSPVTKTSGKLKVLLATDGSEASLKAALKLPELVNTDAMEVTVVTVQTPYYVDNPVLAPFVNLPYLDQALESNTALVLETTKSVLDAAGVTVIATQALKGSPAYQLIEYAKKEQPDLIVAGSHNLKGVEAWFLGSVSTQLVNWSGSNLLIIR